ncbi:MAG: hypothetical protein MR378_04420 [Ruminococcus sp.]|nr:hypothetical protein [Ruminococcus sp.]
MGTRNAMERRKVAGKHRKESFSGKLEVVAKYEPQATAVELAQLGEGCRGQAAPCREWIMSSNKNLRGTSNLLFAIQET